MVRCAVRDWGLVLAIAVKEMVALPVPLKLPKVGTSHSVSLTALQEHPPPVCNCTLLVAPAAGMVTLLADSA